MLPLFLNWLACGYLVRFGANSHIAQLTRLWRARLAWPDKTLKTHLTEKGGPRAAPALVIKPLA